MHFVTHTKRKPHLLAGKTAQMTKILKYQILIEVQTAINNKKISNLCKTRFLLCISNRPLYRTELSINAPNNVHLAFQING